MNKQKMYVDLDGNLQFSHNWEALALAAQCFAFSIGVTVGVFITMLVWVAAS